MHINYSAHEVRADIEHEGPRAMSQVSVPGGQAVYYGNPPRYAYRITYLPGVVRITTDPVEVARIRRAYPAAQVEIIPVG